MGPLSSKPRAESNGQAADLVIDGKKALPKLGTWHRLPCRFPGRRRSLHVRDGQRSQSQKHVCRTAAKPAESD